MTTVGPAYASTVVESAGWTNASNATGSSNDTPATVGTSGETITLDGYSLSSIPDAATLDTVTLGYRYTLTESRNNYSHSVMPMVSGSGVGTPVTSTGESGATSGGGTGTYADVTGDIADLTVAEMKDANFQLQVAITRTSGTRAFTFSLDSAWITVVYHMAYERDPGTHTEGLTDVRTYLQEHVYLDVTGLVETEPEFDHQIGATDWTRPQDNIENLSDTGIVKHHLIQVDDFLDLSDAHTEDQAAGGKSGSDASQAAGSEIIGLDFGLSDASQSAGTESVPATDFGVPDASATSATESIDRDFAQADASTSAGVEGHSLDTGTGEWTRTPADIENLSDAGIVKHHAIFVDDTNGLTDAEHDQTIGVIDFERTPADTENLSDTGIVKHHAIFIDDFLDLHDPVPSVSKTGGATFERTPADTEGLADVRAYLQTHAKFDSMGVTDSVNISLKRITDTMTMSDSFSAFVPKAWVWDRDLVLA